MRNRHWMLMATLAIVGLVVACVPPPPPNSAPTAAITASPESGSAPLEVVFSSAGSSDPDGAIVARNWEFGDGTGGAHGDAVTHTYHQEGTYTATLTVVDDDGATGSATMEIVVTAAPAATLVSDYPIELNPVGGPIAVAGTDNWDLYELREPGAVSYDPVTDSWIALYTGRGHVVEGNSAVTASIGAAVSNDGETWSPHPQNPLTGVGALGGVGQGEDPYLAKNPDGTVYRDSAGRALMFTEEKDFDVHRGVLLWRSGVNTLNDWTRFGRVLDRGAPGSWSATDVTSPTVVRDGSRLVMLFEGRNMPSQQGEIGIAYSYDDGETFTAAADPIVTRGATGTWNAISIVADEVILVDGTWVLLGHGQSGTQYFPGRFSTTDGPDEWTTGSFSELPVNPITYQSDSVAAWGDDPAATVGVSLDGQRYERFDVQRR